MHSSNDIYDMIRRLASDVKKLQREVKELRESLQKTEDRVA